MNTSGINQAFGPLGPGVQVQENRTQLKPALGPAREPAAPATVTESLIETRVKAPVPQPKSGHQYLDPDSRREYAVRVSEAIRKASTEPYLVGFKPDPESTDYLIEIRKIDGTLVTSFAPEKVLNLNGTMDDLAGMVIDLKT
jgi:hypothetical protein